MARPMFTPEELEELRRFDEALDAEYVQTQEEIAASRKRKIAERNAAYYKANKDKFAEYQAAYREKHREELNAKARESMRRLRERRKAQKAANMESIKKPLSGVRDRKAV